MLNAVTYFETLQKQLKLTKDFHFGRVTGIDGMEDLINASPKHKQFFLVDDTDDGVRIKQGGAWFLRRVVVGYVLEQYKYPDMKQREEVLNNLRTILNKISARLIRDKSRVPELASIDDSRFPYREFPGNFARGTTGYYFTVTLHEPENLVYNADDWDIDAG